MAPAGTQSMPRPCLQWEQGWVCQDCSQLGDPWAMSKGCRGLDGAQSQAPWANPPWWCSTPTLPVLGDQGWEEGGSFFTSGAGETSPSMIFHLTSPCHICQLLLITEFAITLCTDVKGRENRKRRLRDSTIINDVWQAKVPYNAL